MTLFEITIKDKNYLVTLTGTEMTVIDENKKLITDSTILKQIAQKMNASDTSLNLRDNFKILTEEH